MPPSRRRPVPLPPTGRPKVAGLRKRTDQPAPGDESPAGPVTGSPAVESHAVESPAAESPAVGSSAAGSSAESSAAESSVAGSADSGSSVAEPGSEPPVGEPGSSPFVEDVADRVEDALTPKPRPTGRRKRSGEPVPVKADPVVRARDEAEPVGAAGGLVLPIALVVVAAVLAGLGWWFQGRAGDVHYNQALVDSAGTTEVAGQVREAVEKSFSYNFADVSSTEKAANELLVGKAKCQYNAIFGPVRTLAPEQKLVVTVKAVSTGVTSLDGDRATVLLFLDQVTTRTTDNQSGGGIAMMRAGARKTDGRWKVDNMEMFGSTGDQAAAMAQCN